MLLSNRPNKHTANGDAVGELQLKSGQFSSKTDPRPAPVLTT